MRRFVVSFGICLCLVWAVGWGCQPPQVEDGGVMIVMPQKADPATERLLPKLEAYIKALSGSAPQLKRLSAGAVAQVVDAAQEGRAGLVLVLDADRLAKDEMPPAEITALKGDSFRLFANDKGSWSNRLASEGATFVFTAGRTRLAKQYAIYEFLRRLGARFYHPEQEHLPKNDPKQLRARAGTATIVAKVVDGQPLNDYVPDFGHRSYSFHGSHPLEHQESFSDSQHPITEAANVNDWIVKNRGNWFRGAGRGTATGERRAKRVRELNELRKVMGFATGTGITLHNEQQGANAVVDRGSSVPPRQQIEDYVAKKLKDAPKDLVEFGIHFGPTEFTVTPDKETVDWINWAGQKALSINPKLRIIVNNHITGSQPTPNFSDLGCPTQTNGRGRGDYYDLSFHVDPRFWVKLHTVMFYPLEGPAFVYNQKTFSHKLCLMQKASEQKRPMLYFPEGSWWLSFDNPIPVYLPLYIKTRGRDIELIKPILKSRGKGTMDGHRMFTSGHEWGYWQQDYAVGLWHWNADITLQQMIGELMDPFCKPADWRKGCKARRDSIKVMLELMDHQWDLMMVKKDWKGLPGGLYAYYAGEDPADEIAAVTGFEFRPVRVAFRTVSRWNKKQIDAFRGGDMQLLREASDKHKDWLKRLKAIESLIPKTSQSWLAEIVNGIQINQLRAQQTFELYEVVMRYREIELDNEGKPKDKVMDPKKAVEPLLTKAQTTLDAAKAVIRAQEKLYRYPAAQVHGGGLTKETAVPNGTTYPWRVHTKTHLFVYWENRHQQVKDFLAGGRGTKQTLVAKPVFAKPGEALTLTWPKLDGLSADVTLGKDRKLKLSDTKVDLGKDARFWSIQGVLKLGGREIQLSGGVVRSEQQGKTPKKGLKIRKPANGLAQTVLAQLFPPVLWARVEKPSAGLVFAPDLDEDGKASFSDALFVDFESDKDGAFVTKGIPFRLPVVDPATKEIALSVGLFNVVFKGAFKEGKFSKTINMSGKMAVADLVDALIKLAGFDEKGAYQTLGGVLNFDPKKPPSQVDFAADLNVE